VIWKILGLNAVRTVHLKMEESSVWVIVGQLWSGSHWTWALYVHIYTVIQKTVTLNIWHTLYWVNLQHNNHWFAHLTYILLLHYLAKEVGCKNYNFTKHVARFVVQTNKTPSLSTQPVCTENITAYVFKIPPFSFTQAEVSCAIHQQHRPQCFAISHSKCQSSTVSDRPRPELVSDTRDPASRPIFDSQLD